MYQHTSGPWHWTGNEGQFIVTDKGQIVAEIPCQAANHHDGPLIASAPIMLDALIMAQAVLGDLVRSGNASCDEIEAYREIKDVVAKAEHTTWKI